MPLSEDRFRLAQSYGYNPGDLRNGLCAALMNPHYTNWVFDTNSSDFKGTPFGLLLLRSTMFVEQILRRNLGLGRDATLPIEGAKFHAFQVLGIERLAAWRNPQLRREADFQFSADEVRVRTHCL